MLIERQELARLHKDDERDRPVCGTEPAGAPGCDAWGRVTCRGCVERAPESIRAGLLARIELMEARRPWSVQMTQREAALAAEVLDAAGRAATGEELIIENSLGQLSTVAIESVEATELVRLASVLAEALEASPGGRLGIVILGK